MSYRANQLKSGKLFVKSAYSNNHVVDLLSASGLC